MTDSNPSEHNEQNDMELKEFIRQHFLKILKREPDVEGLHFYFNKIKNKEIKKEDLSLIFLNSQEFLDSEQRKLLVEKISEDVEIILQKSKKYSEITKYENVIPIPEPDIVFASCFNIDTGEGGLFYIKNKQLEPIFTETGCYGIFYDKIHGMLFAVTRTEPQIIAFKIGLHDFVRIPIKFSNYVFANSSHAIYIVNNKIYVIATDGEQNGQKATNTDLSGSFVGKIIISDIHFFEDMIIIDNSKIYNPYSCSHHHHINDLCYYENSFYLTSLSYCDPNKNYVKKGVISKLDDNLHAKMIIDKLEQPHSIITFKDRLYVCSSGMAMIFLVDLSDNTMKLEYKGIDAYVRGLLVTQNYLYIGISYSLGRTKSKFTNSTSGLLKFNRRNGETTHMPLPPNCNNIYAIVST